MPNTARLKLETVEGEGLRFSASTGSGRQTVTDSGPGMIAPSPVETLLVALAGCTAMDVISILRKKRQRVTDYEVDVRGVRRDEHPRAFTYIELIHRFRGFDMNAACVEHALELSHTKYCSVAASLDPAIVVTNRYEIQDEGAGLPGAE